MKQRDEQDPAPHKPRHTSHECRITLVHQAALGDTVLLIPILKSLRMRWAGARVSVVMRPEFGRLLAHLGYADAWYSAEAADHTAWFGTYEPDRAVPEWARCEVLIGAVSNGGDSWAEHARAVMQRSGGSVWFLEPRPPREYEGHVTQWHREQLAELVLPVAERPALRGDHHGAVLVHSGSGGAAKCWAAERFITLARELQRRGRRVEFVLGEAEIERWPRELLRAVRGEFACHECLPLVELAEVMRRARAWVGNDSGPTHLAAAVGLPGVALFGPSDDRQWRPVGHVRVVRAKAPQENDLRVLSVEDVLAAVAEL